MIVSLVFASEAKQSRLMPVNWIAASLLAKTVWENLSSSKLRLTEVLIRFGYMGSGRLPYRAVRGILGCFRAIWVRVGKSYL